MSFYNFLNEARVQTIDHLDVDEGDVIEFYSKNTWVKATVVDWDSKSRKWVVNAGGREYKLSPSHEARWPK